MSEHRGTRALWCAALVAFVLAAGGCTQNGGPPTEVTPQSAPAVASTVVLAVGRSAVVGPSSELIFDRVVGDSRCPRAVQCAWAGEAEIALTLRSPAGSQSFQLSDRADAAVVLGLAIKLVSVEPYPRANVPIPAADYRATVRVARN